MTERWIDRFPCLADLPSGHRCRLEAESRVMELPEGARVFGPGQAPSSFLLLLSGSIRVQQVSKGGREILLYRVSAGESCALTTACLLGDESYRAEGVTETACEAIAIPRAPFEELIAASSAFRRFVFKAFGDRITDLCHVIDDIAFSRLDVRLAQKLLQLKNDRGDVVATHQQLSVELGTAREVVTRQLHEFQRRGWLKGGRGLISIQPDSPLYGFARSD